MEGGLKLPCIWRAKIVSHRTPPRVLAVFSFGCYAYASNARGKEDNEHDLRVEVERKLGTTLTVGRVGLTYAAAVLVLGTWICQAEKQETPPNLQV